MCSSPMRLRSGGVYPGSVISFTPHDDVLHLLEGADARRAALAAVPALFEPTHGCVPGGPAGVDLHGAGADPFSDRKPEREIAGVDAAGQAVVAGVGDANGVVDVAVTRYR